MNDADLREFVNDENNFKNLLFLFGHPDGEEYIDRVLPLLDSEKIAFLLSKDERVVDKVYNLSLQPGPIADVVKTIYEARTNQALVNKLDGNALLKTLGFEEYGDFWFNSLATEEGLAEFCTGLDKETGVMDVISEDKRKQVLVGVRANLHWDVKKEWAFGLFVSVAYALTEIKEELDPIWARIWNYLAAQLVRHEIEVTGLDVTLKKVRDRMDGLRDIRYAGVAALSYDLTEALAGIKKREEDQRAASGVVMSGLCVATGMMVSGFGYGSSKSTP